MPSNLYLRLTDYNGKSLSRNGQSDNSVSVTGTIDPGNTQFLEIMSYSCDVAQTLNIGSQSTGAGAGKVTFNPLSITRRADSVSPLLFQASATGTPFKTLELFVVNTANMITVKYVYKLVAVKTIAWTSVDEGVMEMVTFEYGGLIVAVNQQVPDGKMTAGAPVGWNRVKNIADNDPSLALK